VTVCAKFSISESYVFLQP